MRDSKPVPFSVLVATPLGKGGEGGIDRMMDGVRASGLSACHENLHLLFGTTRGRGSIWLSPFYLSSFICLFVWQRAKGRCDLVHINLASDGSTRRKALVAKTASALGVPYVLHLHGADYHEFVATAKPKLRRSIEAMFAGAERVIVLGDIWRKFVIECLPVASHRIVILPNAVAVPKLPHTSNDVGTVRILFLGRIGERKGVPTLLQALSLIDGQDGWRAVIAGDGEIVETKAELHRRNLSERVEVPGWLGADDAELQLANADILVLPSRNENLPMSVIEAMAAGLAIVTTPVGATGEIIEHNVTGLLVPVDDAHNLAIALSRLIGDAELRQKLGQAAQKFHRDNLEINAYSRRLLELWREVAE